MKCIEIIVMQSNVQVSNFENKEGGVNQKVSFKCELAGLPTTVSSYDGLIDENYTGAVELEGNFKTNSYKGNTYGALEVTALYPLQRV